MFTLKYLINFEVNLILNCSEISFIINFKVKNENRTFEITETKLYVPVVTLSTQDNAKLLTLLKSLFNPIQDGGE